ncbi:hypothetical protein [Bacteroides clarus]|uniref:hypothetical protein n=1 Tax=Bacteroides clarus TaxID=626929 RepID=UPI003563CAC8
MSRQIKFAKRYGKILGSMDIDKNYPAFHFVYVIMAFALENNTVFNLLLKDRNKMAIIHFIRMQVECCLDVYACLLLRDKDRFFKYFLDGKPINKLSIGKQNLTAGYLCTELDKRYAGVADIYKEGCKWVHPNKVVFRNSAPEFERNNLYFIGYKDKKYCEDNKQLNDIYKDMLLVNQILYELLQELILPYKKNDTVQATIGQFIKSKKRVRFKRYE